MVGAVKTRRWFAQRSNASQSNYAVTSTDYLEQTQQSSNADICSEWEWKVCIHLTAHLSIQNIQSEIVQVTSGFCLMPALPVGPPPKPRHHQPFPTNCILRGPQVSIITLRRAHLSPCCVFEMMLKTFAELQTINSYFSPKAPFRVAGRTWTDVSCNEGNMLRCRTERIDFIEQKTNPAKKKKI